MPVLPGDLPGLMTPLVRAALAALVALPGPLAAQSTELYLDVGATYATPLVTDDALPEEVQVQQSIAPTVRAGASVPLSGTMRVGAELGVATGGFESRFAGSSIDLGTLTTLGLVATLSGPVVQRLGWRVVAGTLKYFPGTDEGIFAQGGPWRPLLGVGLDYRIPVHRSFDVHVAARADLHSFSTAELQDRGFTSSQWVQRYALVVGLARGGR